VHLEADQLQPKIAVRDLTFSYVPGVPVLKGVTFDIEPGEAVGLVGSSGAGKSTLVDILLGLLEPDGGEVFVGGWPLEQVRKHWQEMIGYVPQSVVLFDDTVRANVAFGVPPDKVDDAQVWNALGFAQLEDVVASLTDGLDNIIGEQGVQLSGGQRQRLGVARAVYHEPKVLMFDEATSALDNETEFKLTEVLEGMRGRLTTITIAHRLSTVRRCDRLFYLEQGRLLAQGTFAQLNTAIPGFARMVELATVPV
jgi:ATP-binding cassette subfamily C protein